MRIKKIITNKKKTVLIVCVLVSGSILMVSYLTYFDGTWNHKLVSAIFSTIALIGIAISCELYSEIL